MKKTLLGLLAISMLCTFPACGDDDDGPHGRGMGASCFDDRDCVDRCARGGDWPGGMCTYSCSDDYDCPHGTACVDKDGGICAVSCAYDSDCYAYGFTSAYTCESTKRKGAGGDTRVCRDG